MTCFPSSTTAGERRRQPAQDAAVSLFDRFAWLYAFLRERIFQDDTEDIVQLLVSFGFPLNNARMVELGCGPGFYATRIARRFRLLEVLGVDASPKLVEHSEARARLLQLTNCRFVVADARALPIPDGTVHAVVSSRLFMVLERRDLAIAEAYRTLRPGGLLFVAEPLSLFWARLPWWTLQAIALLLAGPDARKQRAYRSHVPMHLLSALEFRDLFATAAWVRVVHWQTKRYQYAVAIKPTGPTEPDVSI